MAQFSSSVFPELGTLFLLGRFLPQGLWGEKEIKSVIFKMEIAVCGAGEAGV